MNKLEKIKSKIETNIHNYFVAEEKSWKKLCKKYDLCVSECRCFNKSDYYYSIHIDEDGNNVSIVFDGGGFYEAINCHIISTGDGVEDFVEDYWFCDETASKIFGLSKYDWSPYASYQIDVHAS